MQGSKGMRDLWRHLSWTGRLSLAGIALLVVVAFAAPWLVPHDPMETDPMRRLAAPTATATGPGFWLGCDQYGQDVFSRLVYGTRLSLGIGFSARTFALAIGLVVGLLAGYFGGWTDWLLMRLVDIFLAFPSLLLAIAISMVLGNGLLTVILAIGVVGWAETARIVRSQAMELRSAEFVQAAQTMGAGHLRIILTHLLPNCLPLIIVIFAMGMATAILAEASLSFLGLGVDPALPTWGGMVAAGKDYLWAYPGLALYPGCCIALVVILFNVLGDELRDVLDPGRKGNWLA
ncbi:MAG: ABC transporter permease [Candidatus Riflebacteria bacterium]|nr:ABC transporter permease [Candidatus Riflebacteria bacterium]